MAVNVAIWDDYDISAARDEIVNSGVEVKFIEFTAEEMAQAMSALISSYEEQDPTAIREIEPVQRLEQVDVLVIDENLRGLKHARCSTAEELVGPLRAIIGCPSIVVLNRLYHDMDLTLLEEGLGDVDVKTERLSNPWLWSDSRAMPAFAPWGWPALARSRPNWESRIEKVKSLGLHSSISRVLDLDPDLLSAELDSEAAICLAPDVTTNTEALNTNLRNFFLAGEIPVPLKYREKLSINQESVLQICAGELALWVKRKLLLPQSILVDLPHLALRAPWILQCDPNSLDNWNSLVLRETWPAGIVNDKLLERHTYPGWATWAGRPCVYWPSLRKDPEFESAREEFEAQHKDTEARFWDFVFLEDHSRFTDPQNEDVLDFRSAHHNIWATRQVSNWAQTPPPEAADLNYGPARRRML